MDKITIPQDTIIEVWQDNQNTEIPESLLHNESLEFIVNKEFRITYDNKELSFGVVKKIMEKNGIIDIDFPGITLVINN